MASETVKVVFKVKPEEYERLKKLASANEWAVSTLVRVIVRHCLENPPDIRCKMQHASPAPAKDPADALLERLFQD